MVVDSGKDLEIRQLAASPVHIFPHSTYIQTLEEDGEMCFSSSLSECIVYFLHVFWGSQWHLGLISFS